MNEFDVEKAMVEFVQAIANVVGDAVNITRKKACGRFQISRAGLTVFFGCKLCYNT